MNPEFWVRKASACLNYKTKQAELTCINSACLYQLNAHYYLSFCRRLFHILQHFNDFV
jgi:hypothetical protein